MRLLRPRIASGWFSTQRSQRRVARVSKRTKTGVVLLALLVCSCVLPATTDTVPLPRALLEPPQSDRISSDGYRLEAVPNTEHPPDLLLLVAMSGGGKRSAAYAYGALKGMREVALPGVGQRSLLSSLDGISGVSGGSFTAAYYGLYRDAAFGRYETDFLYADTDSHIKGVYLLPWNWGWVVDSEDRQSHTRAAD